MASQTARGTSSLYAKGAQRREKLLVAAADLLGRNPLDEVSLKDIAEHADIPVGSAYHFFANASDVHVALAQRFMATLYDAIAAPYSGAATTSWQALFDAAVGRGAKLYEENPAYRQLIIGGKAPPEIKLADRDNDVRVGELMIEVISRHFELNTFKNSCEVFFYAVEIVDLMMSLSVIRHGVITRQMLKEAQKAGRSYLREYLPDVLPPRRTKG